MSDPIAVLPLDTTGLNPVCFIHGEIHSPAPGVLRLLIPNFGAFYKQDLRVFNPVTNVDLLTTQYQTVDLWQEATEISGKEVFNTLLITDVNAPAEIAVSYRAYGGPFSRNGAALVQWLHDRTIENNTGTAFTDLNDIPKYFKPEQHLHLLAHVYGMEKVVSSLGHVKEALINGAEGAWKEAIYSVEQALSRLRQNAEITVDSLVMEKYNAWREETTLFTLGCDLLYNYPCLGEVGAQAALGNFATPSMQDDRYVDVKGLGSFAKSLVERCVLVSSTNLDAPFSELNAPSRGSIYAAVIGETFTLPTPSVAVATAGSHMDVYPKDYPTTDKFVIHKLAGDVGSYGCIVMGFNPTTGDTYLGTIVRVACNTPIVWKKFFFQGDLSELEALVVAHAKTNNNPHEVDKAQIQLSEVENLPVVTVDDILARTGTRKYVTMDALLYHMRAFMENAVLPLGPDGTVDLNKNPMSDAKIVFAPYQDAKVGFDSNGNAIPPKGQFISSFCDGTDKYTRSTDGNGSFTDTLTQPDSDDCKYFNVPTMGTNLGELCEGVNKKIKYADGKGGTYTEMVRTNDPECGYVAPLKSGSVIATFCSGVNQVVRYADGHGGYYDLPSMINTYLCGGTIYPATGTGTSGSGGATPGVIKIYLASSHTKLYVGTTEVITIYFTGLTPSVTYEAQSFVKSPTANGGAAFQTLSFQVTGASDGTYRHEITTYDDGSTVPRGVYDNWVTISSENKESNHITRTFIAGTPPNGDTSPNATPSPNIPTQTPAPGQLGVDGLPYNPGDVWPPPPMYSPEIQFSTTAMVMTPGTNEAINVILTGFYASTTYTVQFWAQSPAANNNAPVMFSSKTVVTDAKGVVNYTLNLYDDGTTARGDYTTWITVDKVNSNNIVRSFVTSSQGTGYKYNPAITYASSLSVISPGLTETQTVVMTGFEKNKLYTINFRNNTGNDNVLLIPIWVTTSSLVIKTDDNGYYRYETSITDDGVTVPRGVYENQVVVTGLQIASNSIYRRFLAGAATTPSGTNPKIDVSSNLTTIAPGTTETITVRLTGFAINSTFTIDLWIRSPVVNNNADFKVKTISLTTNNLGTVTYTLTQTDDGVTVPRGVYQNWATCAALAVSSSVFVRTFIVGAGSPTTTPAPNLANAKIAFSTDHPTISPGIVETMTVNASGFLPNTAYTVDFYSSSDNYGNGGQAIKTLSKPMTTNSTGTGVVTHTGTDDGVTVPRGDTRNWIVISGVTSNVLIRTFTGTPPPTVTYNPVLSWSTTTTTLTAGTQETQTISLTGFMPNTSYVVKGWAQMSNYNNNTPVNVTNNTVVTDQTGKASFVINASDDGVTVPRGACSSWFTVPAVSITSNTIIRTFMGTPAPTAPPYNPSLRIWSSLSTVYAGSYETFYIVLSGMRPSTTYTVVMYTSSPVYQGGAAVNVGSRSMTTNLNGEASLSWSQTDDGVTVPRGAWTSWGVVAETGTTSATNTRVFI